MKLPDLKEVAHEGINSLEGTVIGMIQIVADDTGHVTCNVGGMSDVLVRILSGAMQKNHQIKDLIEAAYCEATDVELNLDN